MLISPSGSNQFLRPYWGFKHQQGHSQVGWGEGTMVSLHKAWREEGHTGDPGHIWSTHDRQKTFVTLRDLRVKKTLRFPRLQQTPQENTGHPERPVGTSTGCQLYWPIALCSFFMFVSPWTPCQGLKEQQLANEERCRARRHREGHVSCLFPSHRLGLGPGLGTKFQTAWTTPGFSF